MAAARHSSRAIATATCVVLALAAIALPAWAAKPPPKGSAWSAQTPISPIEQPDPTRGSQLNDVAINASGVAVAAWDQFTYNNGGSATIGAAVRSGGRWGAPFTISGTTGFSMTPKAAVGTDGTIAVSWIYQDPSGKDNVQVATRPAGASAWTTSTLASFTVSGVAITRSAPVAIDAAGNVTAVWNIWDGARNVVQSATLPKGGTWSSPTTLSGPKDDALYFSLAVNARGDAAVAYTLSPYSGYLSGTWAEYTFRSASGSSWTTPVQVSEVISSSVGYVTNPLVALDASGLATVAYMGSGLEVTRQLAGGGWTATPAPVISSAIPGASFLSPDLAVDGSGNAYVAVAIFDPTINVDRSSVWVSRAAPGGAWSPQQRITDPTVPVDAYATGMAVSPEGGLALVGWIDHYHGVVQVSRFTNGSWGPATTIGKGTAWAAFQEVLGLDAASNTVAQAIWKNAKTGTQTYASTYQG